MWRRNCRTPELPGEAYRLMLNPTPRFNRSDDQAVSELTVRALFDSEEGPLLRYAFSLLGRRAIAEEIVQDVFLQLHLHWDDIDSPRAWLFRSVRNGVFNHLRRSHREITGKGDSDNESADDPQQSPEALLLRMEATGALRQELEDLGETDRRLINLKYFEGLKYREISEQTGLSVGNVGYRLNHILKELAGKLRSYRINED